MEALGTIIWDALNFMHHTTNTSSAKVELYWVEYSYQGLILELLLGGKGILTADSISGQDNTYGSMNLLYL